MGIDSIYCLPVSMSEQTPEKGSSGLVNSEQIEAKQKGGPIKMRSLAIAIVMASVSLAAARADTELVPSSLSPMVGAPMLLSACLEDDPGIHCDPYIAGVVDSIISNRMVFQFNPICIPPDLSINVFRSLTINFIQTHPELPQNAIAASAVVTALTEAYPCAESESTTP